MLALPQTPQALVIVKCRSSASSGGKLGPREVDVDDVVALLFVDVAVDAVRDAARRRRSAATTPSLNRKPAASSKSCARRAHRDRDRARLRRRRAGGSRAVPRSRRDRSACAARRRRRSVDDLGVSTVVARASAPSPEITPAGAKPRADRRPKPCRPRSAFRARRSRRPASAPTRAASSPRPPNGSRFEQRRRDDAAELRVRAQLRGRARRANIGSPIDPAWRRNVRARSQLAQSTRRVPAARACAARGRPPVQREQSLRCARTRRRRRNTRDNAGMCRLPCAHSGIAVALISTPV